ncbi:hypothetical protein BS78_06G038700 [Paspalum vaginatum]|nr:hypothetical protein BS78_06G038700 [Paspalum vaginatum]
MMYCFNSFVLFACMFWSQKAFSDSFYAYLRAIFLEASIAIGNRFYPFLSCLQLTLPLQVCSKALAELHKKNEHILYSLPGMESRKNVHQSRRPVGLTSFLFGQSVSSRFT